MRYHPTETMVYFDWPKLQLTRPESGLFLPTLQPIKVVPKCKCHGLNKRWYKDRTKPNGGAFRCVIKRQASQRAYSKRRYNENQIYRTLDVIRKSRQRRDLAILRGEEQLHKLKGV